MERYCSTNFPYDKRYFIAAPKKIGICCCNRHYKDVERIARLVREDFNNARAIKRVSWRDRMCRADDKEERFMQVDRWWRYRQHCAALL